MIYYAITGLLVLVVVLLWFISRILIQFVEDVEAAARQANRDAAKIIEHTAETRSSVDRLQRTRARD